jgi:ribose/xylose/arabinose/galactoside ABC-type transport system permease subunit
MAEGSKERTSLRAAIPTREIRFRPSGPALGLLAVLTLFVILLAWRGELGRFLHLANLQVLFHKNSVILAAALGTLLVIVSGGIDLSIGSVVALVTVVSMQVFRMVFDGPEYALPESLTSMLDSRGLLWKGTESTLAASVAAVAAGLAVGGLCGLVNGLVITRLRLAPFVATLGMMSIARGLAVWLAGRTRISFRGKEPSWIGAFSRANSDYVFDLGVWSVLVLAVAAAIVLRYTVFGRYCYAIGSNEATARLCGVDVDRQKVVIYTLAGLMTGWAGLLVFAHDSSGDPNSSVGLELDVIAAVVIGGAALSGGQGTVGGTLLGVLIFGILENGVSALNVPVEVKYILIGAIVIVNTALSGAKRARDVG